MPSSDIDFAFGSCRDDLPELTDEQICIGFGACNADGMPASAANITAAFNFLSKQMLDRADTGGDNLTFNPESGLIQLRRAETVLDSITVPVPGIGTTIPRGSIVMWPGAVDAVPTGWALCDGTQSTPDLRGRMVLGVDPTYALGTSGGSATHTHTGSASGHALTAGELPAHRHAIAAPGNSTLALGASDSLSQQTSAGGDTEYILRGSAGAASLGLTGATGTGDPHAHGLTMAAESSLPPYFALHFIMKL